MRGLLLVLLVAPLGALAASRFHERNHTGLLFLYDFTEGQVPTSPPTQARDFSGRFLMGNLTTSTTGAVSWNATRQGMTVPSIGGGVRAVSQMTSAGILQFLSTEFTIEFFIARPIFPLSQSWLIAGFGDWPPGEPFAECDAGNVVSEGGWRLNQRQGHAIEFEAVFAYNGVPICVSNTIGLQENSLEHLIVRARDGTTSMVSKEGSSTITLDGQVFSPALWSRHAAPLVIASPHVSNAWTGTLYMIAMYDRYLSNAEIAANRVFGPPNSVPHAATAALALNEDLSTTLFP
jgi:hypothetical protein